MVHNLAKREAGQLIGRWVMVFGADVLEPVARRWKTQINELAKAWAQFEAAARSRPQCPGGSYAARAADCHLPWRCSCAPRPITHATCCGPS